MKKIITLFFPLFLLVVFTGDSLSQDDFSDEAMQKWMSYMTPGQMHEKMASNTGAWKTKSTMWMTPESEPTVSVGTSNAEMIMGGRYLVSKHSGSIMGMPFEGMSIEGYDNATQTFNAIWIDNMGTGIMHMKGKLDPATDQITYTGQMVDPMTGEYVNIREVVTFNSDGSINFDMYCPFEGKEFKTLNLVYTR
jgi:hypothetical protein